MRINKLCLSVVLAAVFTFCSYAAEIKINGFTEPVHDVVLGLPESGRIADIKVKEGSFVKQGEIILYIEKKIEELELRRNRLTAESNADIRFANVKKNVLATQYASAGKLRESGNVISRDDFEMKKIEYEQASAEADKISVQKQLQKIEVQLASEKLNRKILKAPFSGYISEIAKDEGESIQAHEKLVRIVDSGRGVFVGSIEASLVSDLSTGKDVVVRIKTTAGTVDKKAKIIFVSPTIDTASGLIKIKAEFDNSKSPIRLGAMAELFIK